MFTINEDLSIYITRGDVALFTVSASDENGNPYMFKAGDVVRIKVFDKKACENVRMQKDFGITEDSEEVTIYLEEKETKIGDVISKPKDYWYEVELNPYYNPQTIIGYDDDGPKIFKLFPEGKDIYSDMDEEELEEVTSVLDSELSLTSTNPVQNQAIARAVAKINQEATNTKSEQNEKINQNQKDISNITDLVNSQQEQIDAERERINTLTKLEEGSTTGDLELIDARIDKTGFTHGNVGEHIRTVDIRPSSGTVGQFLAVESVGLNGKPKTFKAVDKPTSIYIGSGDMPDDCDLQIDPDGYTPDYIVESRTYGIWTYRKWASGIAECWGVKHFENVDCGASQYSGFYYSDPLYVDFPPNLFSDVPNVVLDRGPANYIGLLKEFGSSKNTACIIVAGLMSTTTSFYVNIQAKGRWK